MLTEIHIKLHKAQNISQWLQNMQTFTQFLWRCFGQLTRTICEFCQLTSEQSVAGAVMLLYSMAVLPPKNIPGQRQIKDPPVILPSSWSLSWMYGFYVWAMISKPPPRSVMAFLFKQRFLLSPQFKNRSLCSRCEYFSRQRSVLFLK